ncbi:MAG: LysR family transcriptional regulator [Sphingomonadaceae bacterium]
MENQNWLADLHLFVAVGKANSFTRAAAALNIPRSTLSRRLGNLEKKIGLRLLNRSTRHVALTQEGVRYFARAERIVDEARVAHEDLLDCLEAPAGLLRLSMPADIIWRNAMAWITEFATLYPAIELELDTAPDHADPVADGWDICIHENAVRDSGLIVRPLATFSRNLFAAPSYIAEHGMPQHPDELVNHQCICAGRKDNPRNVWRLFRGKEAVSVLVTGRLACGSLDLSPHFAQAGFGIAAGIPGAYSEFLGNGSLIPVLPDWDFEPLSVVALIPTRLIPAKTRVFLDFFQAKMQGSGQEFGRLTEAIKSGRNAPDL